VAREAVRVAGIRAATYAAGSRMTVYTDESVRVTPAAAGGQ
jgi:hypothetical protein